MKRMMTGLTIGLAALLLAGRRDGGDPAARITRHQHVGGLV